MQQVPPFSVRTTSQDGVAWLALRGELDMSVVNLIREPLATFAGDGVASIVVDLHDLTFLDSSGLHAILGAWRLAEANGHRLRVTGVSKAARRVFEITATEFLIDEREVVSPPDRFADGDRPAPARDDVSGDQRV